MLQNWGRKALNPKFDLNAKEKVTYCSGLLEVQPFLESEGKDQAQPSIQADGFAAA